MTTTICGMGYKVRRCRSAIFGFLPPLARHPDAERAKYSRRSLSFRWSSYNGLFSCLGHATACRPQRGDLSFFADFTMRIKRGRGPKTYTISFRPSNPSSVVGCTLEAMIIHSTRNNFLPKSSALKFSVKEIQCRRSRRFHPLSFSSRGFRAAAIFAAVSRPFS